jgi:hypothetical protein
MSKQDLKAIRGWLKNVRKFSTGTKYGYHPSLDLPTICIKKYLRELDGAAIQELAFVTINDIEVEIGNFLRALRRDNRKSKQRLNAIGEHENLNTYLQQVTLPSARTLKNMIAIMTDEIEADIAVVKAKIELTLLKAK